uniref:deoxyuridine 5'-triphosphate nucleotidohydrolase-like n=1 Tax=Callospermophilus lateralis TaxID=76772 RepID=UPI0040388CF6
MGPSSGPLNNRGHQQSFSTKYTIRALLRATPDSAGLDLASSESVVIPSDSSVLAIPTKIYGPLPKGTFGLILGRSSASLQGIKVIPGVVDSDFTGEIKILIEPPSRKTLIIHKGQKIAQILLLPYLSIGNRTISNEQRQTKGFGSSDMAFWVQKIQNSRPMKKLEIQEK